MSGPRKALLIVIIALLLAFAGTVAVLVRVNLVGGHDTGSENTLASDPDRPAVVNIDTHTDDVSDVSRLESYAGSPGSDGIEDDLDEIVRGDGDDIPRTSYSAVFFPSPSALEPDDDPEYLAVIGDSFSAGTFDYDYWPEILAETMDYDGAVDMAVVGSGFVRGGNLDTETGTFSRQLGDLIASSYFTGVTDIVVYGCTNDFMSGISIAEEKKALDAFMDVYFAVPSKKRPSLHLCLGNAGYGQNGRYDDAGDGSGMDYGAWLDELSKHCRDKGYPLVDNVRYFLMNREDMFANDMLHPNVDGQQVIASYMKGILSGHYDGVHTTRTFSGLTGSGMACPTTNTVNFDNGRVDVTVRFDADVTVSGLGGGDSYIDLGSFCGYAGMYSLMIGRESDAAGSVARSYSTMLDAATNQQGYIGVTRLMCDVCNHHVYLNVVGAADAFAGREYVIKAGTQASFSVFPTR